MTSPTRLPGFAKRSALTIAAAIALAFTGTAAIAADTATSHHAANKTAGQTAVTAHTQFAKANGIRFAYRRFGKPGKLPLVFNQHFTGNLDN